MTIQIAEEVRFAVAASEADRQGVLTLRQRVYAEEEGRIGEGLDFSQSFDRFDAVASFILASTPSGPVGVIKVIPDGQIGLPCEEFVSLAERRSAGVNPVEFGHLITLPETRKQNIALGLMRAALKHSVEALGATHIIADLFVDKADSRHVDFYRSLGFEDLHGPYRDPRFLNAPESLLLILEIRSLARRREMSTGRARDLLTYFLS